MPYKVNSHYIRIGFFTLIPSKLSFPSPLDAAISSNAKEAIYALQQTGLLKGDEQRQFRPTTTLFRAAAATILQNLLP